MTLRYMQLYGIENVRGARWTSINFSEAQISSLARRLRAMNTANITQASVSSAQLEAAHVQHSLQHLFREPMQSTVAIEKKPVPLPAMIAVAEQKTSSQILENREALSRIAITSQVQAEQREQTTSDKQLMPTQESPVDAAPVNASADGNFLTSRLRKWFAWKWL